MQGVDVQMGKCLVGKFDKQTWPSIESNMLSFGGGGPFPKSGLSLHSFKDVPVCTNHKMYV